MINKLNKCRLLQTKMFSLSRKNRTVFCLVLDLNYKNSYAQGYKKVCEERRCDILKCKNLMNNF